MNFHTKTSGENGHSCPFRTLETDKNVRSPLNIKTKSKTRVLGLALGSGGARGLAHVGVMRALRESGLEPDVIAGTSAGSIVGAAYAAGRMDALEEVLDSMDWRVVAGLFIEFGFNKDGLLKGTRVMKFLKEVIPTENFGALKIPLAMVATDLDGEREFVFRAGPVHHAMRASIAIPGVFTPVQHEGRLLADGGLVNPVPVSVARAMGATHVIAVDINTRCGKISDDEKDADKRRAVPSVFTILTRSFRLYENALTRALLEQSPPDILIAPPVGHVQALDFLHAKPCVHEGYVAAMRAINECPTSKVLSP